MKLLICTQAVDTMHPALGFFHRWIEEFAKHYEHVHVICLFEGEHHLPANVTVHSLGKEGGESRVKYLWRFYRYIWQLRHEYDAVFVHMIPEYILIGGLQWALLRKPVNLWYTHGAVSIALRFANLLTKKIFTAHEKGMNLKSNKIVVTAHGIDLSQFDLIPVSKDIDLITIGRITKSKNLEELIDVFAGVRNDFPFARLTIIGVPTSVADKQYMSFLQAKVKNLNIENYVIFIGAIPHSDVPKWLIRAKVFVHAAQNGSLDKVLLEAIAARIPVVSSAVGASMLPLGSWQVDNRDDFVQQTVSLLKARPEKLLDEQYTYVATKHSLEALITKLAQHMSGVAT